MTGITCALQLADAAYGFNLPVTLGGSAGHHHAHLATVIPNYITIEVGNPESDDGVTTHDVTFENGKAILGDKPGLGIEINREALEEARVAKIPPEAAPAPSDADPEQAYTKFHQPLKRSPNPHAASPAIRRPSRILINTFFPTRWGKCRRRWGHNQPVRIRQEKTKTTMKITGYRVEQYEMKMNRPIGDANGVVGEDIAAVPSYGSRPTKASLVSLPAETKPSIDSSTSSKAKTHAQSSVSGNAWSTSYSKVATKAK